MSSAAASNGNGNKKTITEKWAVSIPMLLIIVSIVVTNLGMYYGMEGKHGTLQGKVQAIKDSVIRMEALNEKMHDKTSTELLALRMCDAELRKQITDLRVELATLKAQAGTASPARDER